MFGIKYKTSLSQHFQHVNNSDFIFQGNELGHSFISILSYFNQHQNVQNKKTYPGVYGLGFEKLIKTTSLGKKLNWRNQFLMTKADEIYLHKNTNNKGVHFNSSFQSYRYSLGYIYIVEHKNIYTENVIIL